MRLVDATTVNCYYPVGSAGLVDGVGLPWTNYMDGGDGETPLPEENPAPSDSFSGDGTHGLSNGDGMCTHAEYHVFGGSYVVLTLLEAWENL